MMSIAEGRPTLVIGSHFSLRNLQVRASMISEI